jgi:hypothetical protein
MAGAASSVDAVQVMSSMAYAPMHDVATGQVDLEFFQCLQNICLPWM